MGPIAWVINSEIYPNWARSTGVAIATAVNWLFNFIISETFLYIVVALTKYGISNLSKQICVTVALGAFFLYASITIISFFIFLYFVPETKGLPIEEVENLFRTKAEKRQLEQLGHKTYVPPPFNPSCGSSFGQYSRLRKPCCYCYRKPTENGEPELAQNGHALAESIKF